MVCTQTEDEPSNDLIFQGEGGIMMILGVGLKQIWYFIVSGVTGYILCEVRQRGGWRTMVKVPRDQNLGPVGAVSAACLQLCAGCHRQHQPEQRGVTYAAIAIT